MVISPTFPSASGMLSPNRGCLAPGPTGGLQGVPVFHPCTFRCPRCGWEGNAELVGALNLKKKWEGTIPPLGPLAAAAKEAKAKTAPAGLADKGAVGCAANAG